VPEAIQYPAAVSQQPLRMPILGATADHSIFCPAASVGIASALDVSGDGFHRDGLLDTKERAIIMVRRRAYTNYDWLRGDLNLQAKSLMLLRSIPRRKENPSNLWRLLGFFTNLVAGTRNHLKLLFEAAA
jgi:hypothetical protein